ncbi:voltage-dependent calcium channel gamma-7 subunit-like [Centruroides sculpturatus]|uniref:voltage-dependent calcium channel gamma-7 subunit-like n=1 Tax=Centruroides sculpturatus TaxID=218467 RepID=UPI000C6E57D5|nr:voltage-dependent calcium channel gamma-7 subunit-like [Centruroides sculpturatus]
MAGIRSVHRDAAAQLLCEQRALLVITVASIAAILLWMVAMGTEYWFYVEVPNGVYTNKTDTMFLKSHSGLWKLCKTEVKNVSGREAKIVSIFVIIFLFFLIIDYTRTETAFSIISLCLMVMGLGFSLYTFKEPRYMFKRLAGGVHFLTAATVLVVIEVLINSIKYEERYLSARHPKGASLHYGFSFVLGWITFVVFIIAGCLFIYCSRKRKGDKAPSEYHAREDEPNILGRM